MKMSVYFNNRIYFGIGEEINYSLQPVAVGNVGASGLHYSWSLFTCIQCRKQFSIKLLSVLSCSFGMVWKMVTQLDYYGNVTTSCGILEIIP